MFQVKTFYVVVFFLFYHPWHANFKDNIVHEKNLWIKIEKIFHLKVKKLIILQASWKLMYLLCRSANHAIFKTIHDKWWSFSPWASTCSFSELLGQLFYICRLIFNKLVGSRYCGYFFLENIFSTRKKYHPNINWLFIFSLLNTIYWRTRRTHCNPNVARPNWISGVAIICASSTYPFYKHLRNSWWIFQQAIRKKFFPAVSWETSKKVKLTHTVMFRLLSDQLTRQFASGK